MLKEATVIAIKKDGVVISTAEGERTIPADTVVIAAGAKPNNDLYEALKDEIENINIIGDSVAVAKIPEAIRSGYDLAISL